MKKHMKGYSDCNSTNTYCASKRSVMEKLCLLVLIFLSHATSVVVLSFYVLVFLNFFVLLAPYVCFHIFS